MANCGLVITTECGNLHTISLIVNNMKTFLISVLILSHICIPGNIPGCCLFSLFSQLEVPHSYIIRLVTV